jgi:hypothetical protein
LALNGDVWKVYGIETGAKSSGSACADKMGMLGGGASSPAQAGIMEDKE